MQNFILQLKARNETLFYYGLLCLLAAIVFLILARTTTTRVYNVNAWYKPFKFTFSTFTLVWAMAWYCYYLPSFNIQPFNWALIILMGFEIFYIAIMAGQGKTSHYNTNTPFYSAMFSIMALAATVVTLYIAFVGLLFFTNSFTELPKHYVWAIRLGISIFVVFSFEGFLMGSRMSNSIGLKNNNSNLFILGWSKISGDLRVSHFIGMHALQVLPILSFYLLKNTKLTILIGFLYSVLALFTLIQALNGTPLFKSQKNKLTINQQS